MNILITGGTGKLGRQLNKIIGAYSPSHSALDVTDRARVFEIIEEKKIDTIVHCAANTSVRFCEVNRKEAYTTNVTGTKNLYETLVRHNPENYFVYVSTACVFSGSEPDHFYSEEDIPHPTNYYGLTKLLGETVISRELENYLIIRTNFIERGKWPYESAFMDRFANYIYSDQLALEIKKLVDRRAKGLLHICGDTRMSMYEFAKLNNPGVKPMTLKDYEGPPLTVNMCLTSKKIPLIKFEDNKGHSLK